jgi:TetR/AcrR family transcriptional repressor of nem operon
MALTSARRDADTADRILDAAELLVQTRGFNGFSYAHIAAEVGVTKASLHYHFASKAELGEALIVRYAARFVAALETIDEHGGDAPAKLAAYAALYSTVLRSERMCLCGILAAEYQTLPRAMSRAIVEFFDTNQRWLAGVLTAGRAERTLSFSGEPRDCAQTVLAALEGAMLVALPYGDPRRFDVAASRLITSLTA